MLRIIQANKAISSYVNFCKVSKSSMYSSILQLSHRILHNLRENAYPHNITTIKTFEGKKSTIHIVHNSDNSQFYLEVSCELEDTSHTHKIMFITFRGALSFQIKFWAIYLEMRCSISSCEHKR